MNKNIFKTLALSLFLCFASSCDEDFLETDPVNRVLEVNYYQTQDEAFSALVSVYDVLQWNDQGGFTMFRFLMNTASDECHAGGSNASDQPNWVAWDTFSLTPNLGPQEGLWRKYYTGIYRANLFLEKLDGVEASAEFKSRVSAEAKFLRAKYYFDLVRLFGRVPLITTTLEPNQYYSIQQSEPAAIYAQVESDLEAAIPDLPLVVSSSEQGRVSKGAGQALLAKTIMFQNEDSRMGEAAALLETVINSGVYSLTPNYGDIFSQAGEFNSESVFEIAYADNSLADWNSFGSGYSEGNVGVQFVGMRDYDGPTFAPGWGFCPVSESLVDALEGDPRFEHTIIDANAIPDASYSPGYQDTGYFIRKYAPLAADASSFNNVPLNWSNNVREIRYADVLLMAAEALVRGGGNEANARTYINLVRDRAGLDDITTGGAQLLEDIYTERELELACEGQRYFDLIRTDRAVNVLAENGFQAGVHEYLPIPQLEIDRSNGALSQNTGY